MEPFTVICSTCESRIRVRNPRMVGQLATCPKCQSMIMLAPAGGSLPSRSGGERIEVAVGDAPPADSMAETKEGLPPGSGPAHPAADAAPAPPDEDEYRLAELPAEEADHRSATAVPVGLATAWEPESLPHIPSEQWTSPTTNRTRQYLLIGFLGIAGFVVCGGLFLGFRRWYTAERPATPLAAVPTPLPADQAAAPPAASNPPAAIADRSDENRDAVEAPAQQPVTADRPAADAPAGNNDSGPTAETPSDEAPGAEMPDVPGVEVPDAPVPADAVPADAVPADAVPADAAPAAPQLPKQLAAFAPMLQYEIQPQLPDAIEILSEAPVTAEDLGLTSSAALPEIPAVDLAAQAQVSISALVMAPLPLSQFVSLWSNISGVPTVVDFASLDAAGIDRNQSLSLALVQATTVGSLIPTLGQPLGLLALPQENRYLRLAAPPEMVEQQLPAGIPLEGLISDAAGEKWLLETLGQLFPDAELAWSVADGQLQRPQQADGSPLAPVDWFATLKLLETWRSALGGRSSFSQYAPHQLSARMLQSSDVQGLEAVLQEVTPQARPVSHVLPRICQQAGVHAWLDWDNLGAIGLGPQTTALFITADRPLRRVLADYANEFSLVVAIIDPQSLWLTSVPYYRASPQLYLLPSEGKSADEWQSQLRPLTPTAVDGGVGRVIAIATPDEQFIFVRCCRPTVAF